MCWDHDGKKSRVLKLYFEMKDSVLFLLSYGC